MRIVYTKHAQFDKFAMLTKHGFKVSMSLIREVIKNPEHTESCEDRSKIASKSIDRKHILRIVYRESGDIITVITFYPAKKGRYY